MEMMEPAKLPDIVMKKTTPCWFCEEKPKDDRTNKEEEDPESPQGAVAGPENSETNDASKLGGNLPSRPNWHIPHKVDPEDPIPDGTKTDIVPAAHHLLPGNASVKKASDLHKYMLWNGDNSLGLSGPIGYDINCTQNGVWLPGNYAVRKDTDFKKNFSKFQDPFKNAYAQAAMEKSGDRQLHDAHPEYNSNVLSTLADVATKLDAQFKDRSTCPICKNKLQDANRPPYGLVGRLNELSAEHEKAVRFPKLNSKAIGSGYITSSRVLGVYK